MKLSNLIGAAIVILQVPTAMAWSPFDTKLQMYRCTNQSEAMSCNSCQKLEGRKSEFKVSSDKTKVMWVLYENGAVKDSNTYDNCQVVDEKNWTCEVKANYNDSSYYGGRQVMVNGQFSSWSKIKLAAIPKQGAKALYEEHYSCAK